MPPAHQVVAPAKAWAQSLPLARPRWRAGRGGNLLKSRDSRLRAGLSEKIWHGRGSESAMTLVQLRVVMAGLDPAIHVLATGTGDAGNRVDARVKPAHDDLQLVPIKTQRPIPVPRTTLRLRGNDGVSGAGFISTIALQPRKRESGPRGLGGRSGSSLSLG
jgi:hypothetical protein